MSWNYFSIDGNAPSRQEIEEHEEREQEAEDKKRLQDAQEKTWSLKIDRIGEIGAHQWSATPECYDLGSPVGDGRSIQEAIESFLEAVEFKVDHVDFKKEDVCYVWN